MWNVRLPDEAMIKGYEIHMGRTKGDVGLFKLKRFDTDSGFSISNSEFVQDGSARGNVWGTYIHGIFDNDFFRNGLINSLRARRGLALSPNVIDFEKARDYALDQWADILRKSIDMRYVKDLVS